MIYNITPLTFGTMGTRNGDLIAIINIICYHRKKMNDPELQFHFLPGSTNKEDYIHKFRDFLMDNTDYFSPFPGEKDWPWKHVGVWDYRDISGDHAIIYNNRKAEKKVVVFPLYDASYNVQRNWSEDCLNGILKECNEKYPDYEKLLCSMHTPPPGFNTQGFKVSTDFITNIEHIMTAEVFYGGDTGVSHLASVLEPGPKELNYYYGSHCMIHTIPFYYLSERKGNLKTFWLDFPPESIWE